jgi:2-methylcitrate dehydratase PrpD
METSVTSIVAEYVDSTNYSSLPATAVLAAKRSMLDTLGVAWAGANARGCRGVYQLLNSQGGHTESAIWVHGDRLPASSAALINSLFASALDYDGFHEGGVVHSDAVILPVCLAMAERQHATGRQFLTSLVLGNDLVCRLGLAANGRSGWFNTSLYGAFGAAAATAKLLGIDRDAICNALGLALINACGTQQPAVERCLAKRMQPAWAAHAGILAGLLAGSGISGPSEPFEGEYGLYRMFERGDPTTIIQELGSRYENVNIGLKKYPSCACNHAAIEGTIDLVVKHNIVSNEVKSVQVVLSPYMFRLVGAPFSPGQNPQVSAQFSVQYSVACAIQYRRLDVNELRDEVILSPEIEALAKKINVSIDESNTGNVAPVTVCIKLHSGRQVTRTVESVRGGRSSPLSEKELLEKFRGCTATGPFPLSEANAQATIDRIYNVEALMDVRELLENFKGTSAQ